MRTEHEQRRWEALADGLEGRLLALLESRTGARGLTYAAPPVRLGGGHWAQLYGFRLARAPAGLEGELVLRVMPTSDPQAAREAAIQQAVHAAGFPVPEVRLQGGRQAGLGFPFIIMTRVAGTPPLRTPGRLERLRTLARLPGVLGRTLAALHALDPAPVRAALSQAGGADEADGIASVLAELGERAASLSTGGYGEAMAWLRTHRPAPGASVVCHGDFHPLNLMMARGDVTAVLDWSHALLADPGYDVAYAEQLLRLWPANVGVLPRRLARFVLGRPAAWLFERAWRRASGRAAPDLRWYEALHACILLVRVARARLGITLPALPPDHPWERAAPDAAAIFRRLAGIPIALPARA